jgi:trehalose/maltose transport system substrate-binding protein
MERHTRITICLLLALLLPIVAACGGGATPDPAAEAAGDQAAGEGGEEAAEEPQIAPPEPTNAEQARQYEGVTLTYYGDTTGEGSNLDRLLADKFSEATGIQFRIIPKPASATENYSAYQRVFQAESPEADVFMIDMIWPGAFADHLVDLGPALSEDAARHYETVITNATVDGKLVVMPWFGDFGMLYYRTDLLEKYGFSEPPRTWGELEEQARTIQDGERSEGNRTFSGFVFQGNAYEGLTCNALEWIASVGGGRIVDENGQPTLNNPQAIEILTKVQSWVGEITPRGVTGYQEEDARNVFQGGNAAFMRNWPYAYAAGNADDSPIAGKFDVAPLPTNGEVEPIGTLGGWNLGVSAYSQNPEAAIEFVRYMTSPEVQKYRAIVGSFVPTIDEVAQDPEVQEAMPFLESIGNLERIPRPSPATRDRYNEASTYFFQGVNLILNGRPAEDVLPGVEQQLTRLTRDLQEANTASPLARFSP